MHDGDRGLFRAICPHGVGELDLILSGLRYYDGKGDRLLAFADRCIVNVACADVTCDGSGGNPFPYDFGRIVIDHDAFQFLWVERLSGTFGGT